MGRAREARRYVSARGARAADRTARADRGQGADRDRAEADGRPPARAGDGRAAAARHRGRDARARGVRATRARCAAVSAGRRPARRDGRARRRSRLREARARSRARRRARGAREVAARRMPKKVRPACIASTIRMRRSRSSRCSRIRPMASKRSGSIRDRAWCRRRRCSTCKVQIDQKRDWFGVTGQLKVEGGRDRARGVARCGAPPAAVRAARCESLGRAVRAVAQAAGELADRTFEGQASKGIELSVGAVPIVQKLVDDGAEVSIDETWKLLAEKLTTATKLKPKPPAALNATLRPYQIEGHAWLARLAAWGAGGLPRRRHGPRQDRAGDRAPARSREARAGDRARTDVGRAQLGRRAAPVRADVAAGRSTASRPIAIATLRALTQEGHPDRQLRPARARRRAARAASRSRRSSSTRRRRSRTRAPSARRPRGC